LQNPCYLIKELNHTTTNLPIPTRSPLRRHIFLTVGAIILVTGVALYFGDHIIRENLCDKGQADYVYKLEPSFSLVCKSQWGIVPQDLILKSAFFEINGRNTTAVTFPASAQIVDPNGNIVKNVNFDDQVSFSVRPEVQGEYKATITFLDNGDKKYDPAHTLVGLEFGVAPRGGLLDTTTLMLIPISKFISYSSAIFLGYGGLQIALAKRKSSQADSQKPANSDPAS
jgi:hypothetical protein